MPPKRRRLPSSSSEDSEAAEIPPKIPISQQVREIIDDFPLDPVAYANFMMPQRLPPARFTLKDAGMKEVTLAKIREVLNDLDTADESSDDEEEAIDEQTTGAQVEKQQEVSTDSFALDDVNKSNSAKKEEASSQEASDESEN